MALETGDFTPVEVTKMEQLEHLCQAELDVREVRTFTGGDNAVHRFPNPDFRPHLFEEPPHHEIVFDKALLRGIGKIKKALHDDIVYSPNQGIQPEKKMIVNGIIEGYQGKQRRL